MDVIKPFLMEVYIKVIKMSTMFSFDVKKIDDRHTYIYSGRCRMTS